MVSVLAVAEMEEWWVMGRRAVTGTLVRGRRRFIRFGGIRSFLWWKRRVDLGKAWGWGFAWGMVAGVGEFRQWEDGSGGVGGKEGMGPRIREDNGSGRAVL